MDFPITALGKSIPEPAKESEENLGEGPVQEGESNGKGGEWLDDVYCGRW